MVTEFKNRDDLSADDTELLRQVNEAARKLSGRRVPKIEIAGTYLQSKLAWKVATFREGVLYRLVALTESLALNWNEHSWLLSRRQGDFGNKRALVDFVSEIASAVSAKDTAAIDRLLQNRHFASRDAEWIEEFPEIESGQRTDFDRQHGATPARRSARLRKDVGIFSPQLSRAPRDVQHSRHKYGSDYYSTTLEHGWRHAIQATMVLVILGEQCIHGFDVQIERVADLQRAAKD